jgi:hypothetical protein
LIVKIDNGSVALLASAHEQEVPMSVRRAARLAVLLATVAALLGPAGPALAMIDDPGGGGTPTLLSPADASTLANTPAADPSGSSTSAVDSATALAASSQPGSDTFVEAGDSPQAAVGLALATPVSVRPVCWANAAWHRWGTWPYQQKLTDTTYWCAVYGNHITYRSSSTTASGTFCATGWTASQLIAGGVGPGFATFTTRSSAGFSCATVIPWIVIHTTHHQDIRRGDQGGTAFVGSG